MAFYKLFLRAPARVFILAFVIYDVVVAVIPTLDQRLNTYPFSAFPMFATVRARAPYDQHLHYTVPGDHFEAISDRPLDERAQRWIDHMNRRLYLVTDPAVFEKRLTTILADIQGRFPDFGIHGLRHYLTSFEAPAYPARAHFEPHQLAIMGELDGAGRFRSVLGKLAADDVTLRRRNLDATTAQLVVYRSDELTLHELTATRDGNRFTTGRIAGDPLYVVAVIDGAPWLVATRKAWRWE